MNTPSRGHRHPSHHPRRCRQLDRRPADVPRQHLSHRLRRPLRHPNHPLPHHRHPILRRNRANFRRRNVFCHHPRRYWRAGSDVLDGILSVGRRRHQVALPARLRRHNWDILLLCSIRSGVVLCSDKGSEEGTLAILHPRHSYNTHKVQQIFPPIVTGPTVLLIGVSLISSGLKDWAGGSGTCSELLTTGPYRL